MMSGLEMKRQEFANKGLSRCFKTRSCWARNQKSILPLQNHQEALCQFQWCYSSSHKMINSA